MSANQERRSQTFEEWYAAYNRITRLMDRVQFARDCWDAGVASQQADLRGAHFDELERIIKEQRGKIERLKNAIDLHVDELRTINLPRYEAVVEAARRTLKTLTPTADYPDEWDELQAALNALDAAL